MVLESNFFQRKIDYSWTPISNMGENIALSVVATEDSNFCNHLGLDLKEIYKVITRKEKRGASTITQQLAKNLFLWSGRSWSRKIIEIVLYLFDRDHYSKKKNSRNIFKHC